MLICQIKKFDISVDLSYKNDEFIDSVNSLWAPFICQAIF